MYLFSKVSFIITAYGDWIQVSVSQFWKLGKERRESNILKKQVLQFTCPLSSFTKDC